MTWHGCNMGRRPLNSKGPSRLMRPRRFPHDQRYAMAFVGSWALNYFVESAYLDTAAVPFHWGVTLNPGGPVSRLALISSGIEVAAKHTKNPVAAYWLIKYLTLGSATALKPTTVSASPAT